MPTHAAVLTRGLHVRLGRTDVLTGVDLQVNPGDLYGLLGRNGAGKTTTMRSLLGYQKFQKGKAEVFGVGAQRLHQVIQPIGVALDPPGLDDSLTVRQNLNLARIRGGISGGRSVDEALELVGLSHRAGNYGDRLSHGQGRRAAVARALLGSPQLLVLDEPLSGLDPQGVEILINLFIHLCRDQGVTILLSSHHLREVEHVCNRVGMIEGGTTVLEGDVPTLLRGAGDALRVQCRHPQKAQKLLQKLTGIREIQAGLVEGELRAKLDPDTSLEVMLKQLVQADCGVEEFVRERASLVDVFQNAVGSGMDSNQAEVAA
ncbi:MAG: ABC transporter ATP-binding protein [Planctomycetes bacterium]|nr:ABC transporter ATP-binding protein [Planctomycetota bacterium]